MPVCVHGSLHVSWFAGLFVCVYVVHIYIYIFVLLYSSLAQGPPTSMEGPQIGVQLKMGGHFVFI